MMPHVKFVKGFSDNFYDQFSAQRRNLLVVDDQMEEAGKSTERSSLFTKGSHHLNLTIVYLVQNIFDKGQAHRTVSLNSH